MPQSLPSPYPVQHYFQILFCEFFGSCRGIASRHEKNVSLTFGHRNEYSKGQIVSIEIASIRERSEIHAWRSWSASEIPWFRWSWTHFQRWVPCQSCLEPQIESKFADKDCNKWDQREKTYEDSIVRLLRISGCDWTIWRDGYCGQKSSFCFCIWMHSWPQQ